MDKTDRLRDYGLAFLLYEQGLGLCGYELIRELFIFVKLILNSYLKLNGVKTLKPSLRFFIIILVQHTLNYTCYFFSEPSWLKAGFSRVALPTASSCAHIGLPCRRTL